MKQLKAMINKKNEVVFVHPDMTAEDVEAIEMYLEAFAYPILDKISNKDRNED